MKKVECRMPCIDPMQVTTMNPRARARTTMPRLLPALCFLIACVPVTSVAQAPKPANAADASALDCVVEPSAVVELGSATPGVIARVSVERTDTVEAGQVIAELESAVERATLDLAQAHASLSATLELRQVNAQFGDRQQARTRDLAAKNLLPKQEYDRIETEARVAKLQAREASDDRTLAYLEFKRAQAALERRVIRSPIEGVVVDRFKTAGEYVEDQPIIRIAKIDTLHVEILAPIELLGRVKLGMKARVDLVPAALGSRIATVTRVDQVADAASGTFGVRLELANRDLQLPAGLRCLATFEPAAARLPIAVSSTAVEAASSKLAGQ